MPAFTEFSISYKNILKTLRKLALVKNGFKSILFVICLSNSVSAQTRNNS